MESSKTVGAGGGDRTDGGRRGAVREFKKGLIRDAAKREFAERGIEAASLRGIAQSAGYTTGAIYTYFATKEELYAEVLRDSLNALHGDVVSAIADCDATPAGPSRGSRSAAALRTLWHFYDQRSADFQLGFYLYGGVRATGLSKQLDAELNGFFNRVIDTIGDALCVDGLAAPDTARHLAIMHATWIFGLLLMTKTGRVRSVRAEPTRLLESYLATLPDHRVAPEITPGKEEIDDR